MSIPVTPLESLVDWLATRYSERTLARAVVVLAVLLLTSQLFVGWYFGSVGLSLREMSPSGDDRTVVVAESELQTFEDHYRPDREEGWCLYGHVTKDSIYVDEVVHAQPYAQTDDRIEFTCAPETATQAATGDSVRLVGVAHSHPSKNESYLSRTDTMTWGRTSPVVEVMGIYTEHDGVEFFTVRSLTEPLETEVRGLTGEAQRLGV